MSYFDMFLPKKETDNIMIAQDNNPFGSRFLSPKMKALLNNYTQAEKAKSAVTKPTSYTAEKKDDFLEGFNDPYGEKENFPRQSLAQRMMAQFTNPAQQTPQSPMIKTEEPKYTFPFAENSKKNESTQKVEDDAFLEGFNDPYGEEKVEAKDSKKSVSESISDWGENIGAHIGLHNTAHEQYPWMRYAGLLSPAAIEGRITSSSAKVSKHKDTINEVASRYNVPRELIGGIIFKEQLTKSLPDTIANIDTAFIKKDRYHSTGLGAITAKTARAAWGEVDKQKELPKTDAELQYKLTYDKKFNIETIAAVLLYEAMNKEFISDISEASKLTADQWWKAVAKYNGSDEYARKVYEYLPFTTELLDL